MPPQKLLEKLLHFISSEEVRELALSAEFLVESLIGTS
jgi:hypothetical protein